MEPLHDHVSYIYQLAIHIREYTACIHVHRKPIGVMEGHTAPVVFVRADSTNSRVYSVGNDNTVMVREKDIVV